MTAHSVYEHEGPLPEAGPFRRLLTTEDRPPQVGDVVRIGGKVMRVRRTGSRLEAPLVLYGGLRRLWAVARYVERADGGGIDWPIDAGAYC